MPHEDLAADVEAEVVTDGGLAVEVVSDGDLAVGVETEVASQPDTSSHAGVAVLLDVGPGVDRADVAADAHAVAWEVLECVQTWLADDRFAKERLAIVTHGAIAARPGEDVERPRGSGGVGPGALGAAGELGPADAHRHR